ncbi:NAD-dependent epimerase/dehydratase family protein [Thalassotalea nanhaiensis]|uniref:NAD-dependent epimerase/dehydratase family protein n=1 Tax=Thalassotalea nanhaiensis TaxID=3065648 RepID=A0ABY9TM40_9GAMM|nr:NAD-dependent epimerase/dehydratase family protein [Colwelliaceae bacterium SQ345]
MEFKKILIVGNQGTFFKDTISALGKHSEFSINAYDASDLINNEEILKEFNGAETMLYISGETRHLNKMNQLNIELPSMLLDLCEQHGCNFLYLSSLAVFGWVVNDICNLNSSRNFICEYGRTKNAFDTIVKSKSCENTIQVGGVYPASIYSNNGRSAIDKFERLFNKIPLLKCFKFQGNISYIERKILIEKLIYKIKHSDYSDEILSNHKTLSDFSNRRAIPVPKLPQFIFDFSKKLLGAKKALLLKLIFRGVIYK